MHHLFHLCQLTTAETIGYHPRTKNREPGTKNRQSGTDNQEPTTRNRQPGTDNQEPTGTERGDVQLRLWRSDKGG
jgi:hypothetical protein